MLLQPVQSVDGRLNAEWAAPLRGAGRLQRGGRQAGAQAGRPAAAVRLGLAGPLLRQARQGRRLRACRGVHRRGRPAPAAPGGLSLLRPEERPRRRGEAVVQTGGRPCAQAGAAGRPMWSPTAWGRGCRKSWSGELAREGHGATVIGTPNSRPKHERILDAFDAPLAANALWAHASVFKSPFLRELREWRPENRNGPDDGLGRGRLRAAAGAGPHPPPRPRPAARMAGERHPRPRPHRFPHLRLAAGGR